MSGSGLGPRFGRLEVFVLVKTEENCSFMRRVLLMLSLWSLPSLSSEATPVLSQRLFLMYDHNLLGLLAMPPQIMSSTYF